MVVVGKPPQPSPFNPGGVLNSVFLAFHITVENMSFSSILLFHLLDPEEISPQHFSVWLSSSPIKLFCFIRHCLHRNRRIVPVHSHSLVVNVVGCLPQQGTRSISLGKTPLTSAIMFQMTICLISNIKIFNKNSHSVH